jgi:hypothetical protein
MGISVGWTDVYSYQLQNQSISLAGVSNGTYWLEMVADPLNRLIESDETNNVSRKQMQITTGLASEMDVRGNGQSIPSGDTTPSLNDYTDFGYADVNHGTVTRTFTIQNSGTGQLSFTGSPVVQLSGSTDFVVSTAPVSPVTPNNSTTFQVTFAPTSPGAKTATITIPNNDTNENPYQFLISGNTDANNDGLPDGWESLYGITNPNADDDGDGMSNADEFVAGTSPRDPTSFFRIKSIVSNLSGCQILFDSTAGRTYRVEYRDNFNDNWSLVEQKTGTGSTLAVTDATAVGKSARFYHVTVSF